MAADLQRFVEAQAPVWDQVRAELAAGRKRTHWMWFVFPQLQGLGSSAMARHFAIENLAEAQAYLRHPLLGARLREATQQVLQHADQPLGEIFGWPDDLKFCSSMTLFEAADPAEPLFSSALARLCGARDERTLALLAA